MGAETHCMFVILVIVDHKHNQLRTLESTALPFEPFSCCFSGQDIGHIIDAYLDNSTRSRSSLNEKKMYKLMKYLLCYFLHILFSVILWRTVLLFVFVRMVDWTLVSQFLCTLTSTQQLYQDSIIFNQHFHQCAMTWERARVSPWIWSQALAVDWGLWVLYQNNKQGIWGR